jgi:hypothetical protein
VKPLRGQGGQVSVSRERLVDEVQGLLEKSD